MSWNLVRSAALVCAVLQLAVPAAHAGESGQNDQALRALPQLPETTYRQVDGGDVNPTQNWLVKVIAQFVPANMATRALTLLGGAAECAQAEDIAAFRLYFQRSDPWAVGMVTAISKARVRDPNLWFKCGKQVVMGGGPGEAFSPCGGTIQDPQFWYFYAATKPSVCTDVKGVLLQTDSRRSEVGAPGGPAGAGSGSIWLRPPAGTPAIVACGQFMQRTQVGMQMVNTITVHPPDIIGQSGRDLGGTYTPTLLQWVPPSAAWVVSQWRPSQQGQALVFAGIPSGHYAVQLALQWPDEASGRPVQYNAVVAQYATPGGSSNSGCIF